MRQRKAIDYGETFLVIHFQIFQIDVLTICFQSSDERFSNKRA